MKKVIKNTTMALLTVSLLFGIGYSVHAAAIWATFSNELPRFTSQVTLSSQTKDNNSQSRINTTYVGSTYKANMWIEKGYFPGGKVSGTLSGMTDGSDQRLTVNQSEVGKRISLRAENAAWAAVNVEISGRWMPDTN